MGFRRFVEFFGYSIDRIGHEHFLMFLPAVDFNLSYLVGPRTKFRVLALFVNFNVRSKYVILPTNPNKNGGASLVSVFSCFYYTGSVAKHCDWNQAPGCQRETPQIDGKDPAD